MCLCNWFCFVKKAGKNISEIRVELKSIRMIVKAFDEIPLIKEFVKKRGVAARIVVRVDVMALFEKVLK